MVDAVELQKMARLVDMNRQRLEEIEENITRLESLILEHQDAILTLKALEEGKSGQIPIGAGVMVPLPQGQTTIVDFGSGVFGESTPKDAAVLIQSRLEDLVNVKIQFETEAAQVNQRIEQLATTFDEAAKGIPTPTPALEITEEITEDIVEDIVEEPSTQKTKPRRKRGFGSSLTLDD